MSKIEVDQITQQSGTTVTVGGGACKTAAIDATTVTIGRSGGTVTLTSGATQSGFGRTGTVNWQTTKKTANFTAVSGEGYFCDTAASSAFTLTLPSSPSAGDIVGIKDYNGNFSSANLTIGRGGSPINGGSAADVVLSTAGASVLLVYVDSTQGWVATNDDSSSIKGEAFVTATGGTITTSGNDRIHTFTGPGTFCVSAVADTAGNNVVSYAVVAGGGGGSSDWAGGGGGGGFREDKSPVTPYTASPLDGAGAITVTAQGYPITVGGGGAGGSGSAGEAPGRQGANGTNSVFSTITSAGGGTGGIEVGSVNATNGGSGGGAWYNGSVGSGNTPPVSPAQGQNGGGGGGPNGAGGGGGGATQAGTAGDNPGGTVTGGAGGTGATTEISGSPVGYSGGGGGNGPTGGAASSCGSGGAAGSAPSSNPGSAGATNRGGGGGAGGYSEGPGNGGAGGSGVVIIRYKIA